MDINTPAVVSAFTTTFLVEAVRYLIAVTLILLVVKLALAPLTSRGLHQEPSDPGQVRREFGFSILTSAIFSANGLYIFFGLEGGWVQIYETSDAYGAAYWIGSLVAIIIAHDAWFYWTHRLIHNRALFRWVHNLHHRSRRPTAWAAYSFSPLEAFINASFVPLWVTFVPMNQWAIFVFLAHMILRNAIGHCGFELFPKKMPGSKLFGFVTNVYHHDLHHRDIVDGNFGLYFTWWDRWMGTEHPDYTALVESQRNTAATRLPAE